MPEPLTRPNIVLIMSDQHRADVMGCAGDPVVETPNLDRLAAEGIRFGRAYCQGPLCMPARASFLTERYVRDHGVDRNDSDTPENLPTIVGSLGDNDYHTCCLGKMHFYVHGASPIRHTREAEPRLRHWGFKETIETVGKLATRRIRSAYSEELEEHGLYSVYRDWIAQRTYGNDTLPMWYTGSNPVPVEFYPDSWVGRRSARWVREYGRESPFFIWIGFPGPHDPWDAPEPYVERYRDVEIPLPNTTPPQVDADNPYRYFLDRFKAFCDSDTLTDERIREVRRFYFANVTLIDEQVGAIIDALDERGILDNTWIIYTADHGEMMGEHRLLAKMVFYEPSVLVPLIIRPPGGMRGRVVDDIVEHVDVTATLRAIGGGSAIPEGAGRSLLPYFDEGTVSDTREVAHSQNFGFSAFITDRHKLVVENQTLAPVQLFDLQDDPHENRDLSRDPATRELVHELLEEHVRPFLAGRLGRPSPFEGDAG